MEDKDLQVILQKQGYVTPEKMREAENFAKQRNSSAIDYLLSNGIVTKDLLGQALAEHFKVPYADLNSYSPLREQVLMLPEEIARKYRAVVFRKAKEGITVATDDPSQKGLTATLAAALKSKKIRVAFSMSEDIEESFVHYRKKLETRFSKIIEGKERIAPEIIDEIIADALAFHASDIHFEPQEHIIGIRFRVDGIMQDAGHIPKEYYENVLNRIKVMAHLRTDEHFSAQDGSIRHRTKDREIDLRVSVVPTLDGEKVVLRLLAEYVRGFGMNDLGLSVRDQKALEAAIQKPFGMLLVVGPTGSGKTTTLYSVLKKLNRPEANIATIEDPVEYKVAGVNHIQVNPRTNLTFASGLRSIVRQDPDVILVGEIRDRETAEIAVNAALTGHLLLSTFHANDASTSLPRLLDMGIEPFLLASTLELVIAQRLVRKICESCRVSFNASGPDISRKYPRAAPFLKGVVTQYHGKGCATCSNTGFKGRIAIFEIIEITPEMQDLILTSPSNRQIWTLARKQGARSLFEDGIEKVKNAVTTIEELMRVAAPPAETGV